VGGEKLALRVLHLALRKWVGKMGKKVVESWQACLDPAGRSGDNQFSQVL